MSDYCPIKVLNGVVVQENGLIRDSDGVLIGRLFDDVSYETDIKESNENISG